jgi:hypothetical protein
VDSRTCLDDVEKRKFLTLPGLELQSLSRPALSQSLYRLGYPGSFIISLCYQKELHLNVYNLITSICYVPTRKPLILRDKVETFLNESIVELENTKNK